MNIRTCRIYLKYKQDIKKANNMKQYVDSAVEQFRALLEEQIARQQRMENESGATDY